MTFWDWLDRRWPSERGFVTLGIFALAASMLKMAEVHTNLWDVELFKALLTLVVGSGIINMVLAFHFAANKSDETRVEVDRTRAETTGKMADAMKAVSENSGPAADATDAAANAAEQTAKAAAEKADEFKEPELPNPDFHYFDDPDAVAQVK
jgi:hypothetical protein